MSDLLMLSCADWTLIIHQHPASAALLILWFWPEANIPVSGTAWMPFASDMT
jgi:hypothetical protein